MEHSFALFRRLNLAPEVTGLEWLPSGRMHPQRRENPQATLPAQYACNLLLGSEGHGGLPPQQCIWINVRVMRDCMFAHYACVRQTDQSDCGAAALATVALHYRRPIALQRLRDLAGTDRSGSNLLGLLYAAEALGFSARAVKGQYEALPQVPLPAIAHVKTDEGLAHFVVLHRVTKTRVVVADPAHGIQHLTPETFCQRWTGYLLALIPDPHGAPAAFGQRAGPPMAAVSRAAQRPHLCVS